MSTVDTSDGVYLLGILHEAVAALDRDSSGDCHWTRACKSARWLVPATRVVALVRDGERFSTRAAFVRGEPVEAPSPPTAEHPFVAVGGRGGVPRWFVPPWEELGDEAFTRWVTGDGVSAVLVAPVRTQTDTLGSMVFSIRTELGSSDRVVMSGLSAIYGLFTGRVLALHEQGGR